MKNCAPSSFVSAALLALLLSVSGCSDVLSSDDLNAPMGFALCENINGGHYDLSGGAKCPEKGVEGRKTVLRSNGGDMRDEIASAIQEYDIVVLDGSKGPFVCSSTAVFEGLRNKTIVGTNGAVLRSAFQGSLLMWDEGFTDKQRESYLGSGFWHFRSGSGNIIIRNIYFDGPGAFRGKADTMVSFRFGCDHVWIDHCTFEDFACRALGFTKGSDCSTVSWCTFRITEQSGGHSLGVLIASGDDNYEDEDLLNITFDHCLWQNVWSRIPMARFATVHVLNNYFDCRNTVGINPRTNSEFLVEGCVFTPGTKPYCAYRTNEFPCKACEFRDCVYDDSFEVLQKGSVSVPYEYTVMPTDGLGARIESFAGPTLRRPLKIGR